MKKEKFTDVLSLVLFTSLLPVAIGMEAGATIAFFLSTPLERLIPVLGVALILTATGVLFVTVHLGKKMRGIYVIRGIGHSYLSLEGVVSFLFGFFLFLSLGLLWFSFPHGLISLTLLLTSLFGLATAVIIGKVYDLKSQLTWRGIIPLSGPLLAVLSFAMATGLSLLNGGDWTQMIRTILVLFLCVDVLFSVIRLRTFLSLQNRPFVLTYPHLKKWVVSLFLLRFVFAILVFGCVAMEYHQTIISQLVIMILLDRTLFYASGAQGTPESGISSLKADRMRDALADRLSEKR